MRRGLRILAVLHVAVRRTVEAFLTAQCSHSCEDIQWLTTVAVKKKHEGQANVHSATKRNRDVATVSVDKYIATLLMLQPLHQDSRGQSLGPTREACQYPKSNSHTTTQHRRASVSPWLTGSITWQTQMAEIGFENSLCLAPDVRFHSSASGTLSSEPKRGIQRNCRPPLRARAHPRYTGDRESEPRQL